MSNSHRKITAVLFDLDDTLIDWSQKTVSGSDISRRHMSNVYQYLLSQGHHLPQWEPFLVQFRETMIDQWTVAKQDWSGVKFKEVLAETFLACKLAVDQIDLDHVLHVYDWQPVPGVVPYDDTLTVLESLRHAGYKIGLITNSMQPMWMRDIELKAYRIFDYLDARITSGDAGVMKPHPAIYHRLLHRLDVSAGTAVFVGDRPGNDILGANNAGLISVLIDPPHLQYELNGIIPDFTIHTLTELLPILEELNA